VVADREVQIRPRLRGTTGQRTDIRVQAFTIPGIDPRHREVASLTIEVKGCWNPDLYSAMKTQLKDRYLQTTGDHVGLYVVGWYVCPAWTSAKVAGLVPAAGNTQAALEEALRNQAESLSDGASKIEAFVIDATLN
jgi:hypothetical protein